MTTYTEREAKTLINAIPHSKFSVTKGLSCRLSANTAFGCESSCSYCYIRYLARWKGISPNEIFRHIEPRVNAPSLLAKELRNRRPEWLWIGSTADPYQSFEERYRLMRGCLQVLGDRQFPFEIITKSPLVERDVDLLQASNEVGVVSMSLFSSLDDEKRSRIELKASRVRERIEALRALNAAGVRTMALLLPIIPGYSDDIAEIRELLHTVRDAGTKRLYAGVMRLYSVTWAAMQEMMPRVLNDTRRHIELVYQGPARTVSAGAHVPSRSYRYRLMRDISMMARELGFEQFSCEENFFGLWFGPQDEHAGFRYAIHFDFWLERCRVNRGLTLEEALVVARRFHHTPSFLRSIQENLTLLNSLIAPDLMKASIPT